MCDLSKLTLLIYAIMVQNICFSQESTVHKKDSIMNFLIRGLWIQYEIEKQWNPNNDTLIKYTKEEHQIYYMARITDPDKDSIFIMKDKYAELTAEFFERKTGMKRKEIHRSLNMIKVLDKDLIEEWINWYNYNKENTKLKELYKILNTKHNNGS
jgi:hypothetical protein